MSLLESCLPISRSHESSENPLEESHINNIIRKDWNNKSLWWFITYNFITMFQYQREIWIGLQVFLLRLSKPQRCLNKASLSWPLNFPVYICGSDKGKLSLYSGWLFQAPCMMDRVAALKPSDYEKKIVVANWNSAAAIWCASNMFKKKNQVTPNLSYLSEVTTAGWFSLSLELLDWVEGALAGFWAFLTGVNGLVDGRLFTQAGEVFSDRLPQPELPEPNREPRGENLRALRGERQGQIGRAHVWTPVTL